MMMIEALLQVVAVRHSVSASAIVGRSQLAKIVAARVDLYRALRERRWSYRQIARVVHRDAGSVWSTLARHDGWRCTELINRALKAAQKEKTS